MVNRWLRSLDKRKTHIYTCIHFAPTLNWKDKNTNRFSFALKFKRNERGWQAFNDTLEKKRGLNNSTKQQSHDFTAYQ